MEGCHKILRNIRTRLSRKISQQANMVDIIRRLWLNTDPQINLERRKGWPYCKKCKLRGNSTRYCKQEKSTQLNEDELYVYLTAE